MQTLLNPVLKQFHEFAASIITQNDKFNKNIVMDFEDDGRTTFATKGAVIRYLRKEN